MAKHLKINKKMILLDALNNYETKIKRGFTFCDMGESVLNNENVLKIGIEWPSVPVVTAERAIELGNAMKKAGEFANQINRLEIMYRYGDVDEENTLPELFQRLSEAAENEQYEIIAYWLIKSCTEE